MVPNVQYLNGWPSHMTSLFEYRTFILSGIQMYTVVSILQLEQKGKTKAKKDFFLKLNPKRWLTSKPLKTDKKHFS